MPFDKNHVLPFRHTRDVSSRPRPIKSNKQRGSILSGVNPNLFTVFEDKDQGLNSNMAIEEELEKDDSGVDRVKKLEAAVKTLQKKNERTAIDQKTLSDRLSTTEANFVELKYDLLLSTKPTPSTPARSRSSQIHELPIDSPSACLSLTGAEENTAFTSPPVPALARSYRMSTQGRGASGLRRELLFEESLDHSAIGDQDLMEIMNEDQYQETEEQDGLVDRDPGLSREEIFGLTNTIPNPPPTFDPELSLGEISLIEGISFDAAQAGAYLDNHGNLANNQSESVDAPQESTISDAEGTTVEQHDSLITTILQTDSLPVSAAKTPETFSGMVDEAIQTEEDLKLYCDMAVQVELPNHATRDAGVQTSQEDANQLSPTQATEHAIDFEMLKQRVCDLEDNIASRERSSASQNHTALVDAYKSLLRVEADKRLDLVAAISGLRTEMVPAAIQPGHGSGKTFTVKWALALTHLAVALLAYTAARIVFGSDWV